MCNDIYASYVGISRKADINKHQKQNYEVVGFSIWSHVSFLPS